jgi:hypothetical protein
LQRFGEDLKKNKHWKFCHLKVTFWSMWLDFKWLHNLISYDTRGEVRKPSHNNSMSLSWFDTGK